MSQPPPPNSSPRALRTRPAAAAKSRATLGVSTETCSVSAGPSSPINKTFDDAVGLTSDAKHILRPPVQGQGQSTALANVVSQINQMPSDSTWPPASQARDTKICREVPSGAVARLQNAVDDGSTTEAKSTEPSTKQQSNLRPKISRGTAIGTGYAPRRRVSPNEYAISITNSSVQSHDNIHPVQENLPDDCFFSTVMLVKWSNVVGPKTLKVWTPQFLRADESMLKNVAKQILNGEVGRNIDRTEPKFLVLGDEGMIAASFLFTEHPVLSSTPSTPSSSTPGVGSLPAHLNKSSSRFSSGQHKSTSHQLGVTDLHAFAFLVPVQYMQSFSTYFEIMVDRVPVLVEKLLRLKSARILPWKDALDYFTTFHLVPFIETIMDLESVSLPIENIKISHTILVTESEDKFNKDFVARLITSHLQTHGNTVVIGPNITVLNMLINTLALFLSPAERNRSCHARRNHQYMPDLFLQGLVGQSQEYDTNLDALILESPYPTTLVDLSVPSIQQTDLLPNYERVRSDYYRFLVAQVDDAATAAEDEDDFWSMGDMSGWTRPVFHPVRQPAPMIQRLLNDIYKLPSIMREAYIRQWRRYLVRKALAVIKYFEDVAANKARETHAQSSPLSFLNTKPPPGRKEFGASLQPLGMSAPHLAQGLPPVFVDIRDDRDFAIVLAQAEKMKPGMIEYVRVHLGVG